jgi:hypothetical protein
MEEVGAVPRERKHGGHETLPGGIAPGGEE